MTTMAAERLPAPPEVQEPTWMMARLLPTRTVTAGGSTVEGTRRGSRYPACRATVGPGGGKAESGEHARIEAGQGGDAAAGEGQHHEPVGAENLIRVVASVDGQCELPVGPGGDDAVRAAGSESDGLEESGGEITALVLERQRRHRQPDVLGQEGDNGAQVAVLVGPGELVDKLPLEIRAR
jgi:hypothetical protein